MDRNYVILMRKEFNKNELLLEKKEKTNIMLFVKLKGFFLTDCCGPDSLKGKKPNPDQNPNYQ